DLLGILFGDVLGVNEEQLAIAGVVTLVVVVSLWLVWKELVFVSFDPVGAAAAGLPVLRYDALLLALIGVTIAVSVQVVGIILVEPVPGHRRHAALARRRRHARRHEGAYEHLGGARALVDTAREDPRGERAGDRPTGRADRDRDRDGAAERVVRLDRELDAAV